MQRSELQPLLDNVNNAELSRFGEYLGNLRLIVEKLNHLSMEDKNPMLDAWLKMGLEELRKELNKLNEFQKLSTDKQKTEFMYSKSTVSMSLTNILMNL